MNKVCISLVLTTYVYHMHGSKNTKLLMVSVQMSNRSEKQFAVWLTHIRAPGITLQVGHRSRCCVITEFGQTTIVS